MNNVKILILAVLTIFGATRLVIPLKIQEIPFESANMDSEEPQGANFQLTNFYNYVYYAQIQIGTPPQTLNAIFDTNIPDVWVNSIYCTDNILPYCKTHQKYDPHKSSTAGNGSNAPGTLFGHVFTDGSGRVWGNASIDTISVAGMKVTKSNFINILKSNITDLGMLPYDAIVGLGYKEFVDLINFDPFFQEVINQKLVSDPSYSVYYSQNNSQNGAIIFGGIDPQYNASAFKYYP